MSNRKQSVTLALITVGVIAVLFAALILLNQVLPPQEEVQVFMEQFGVLGYLFYLLFGITAVFIIPLNFSFTGIAGTFVFGFWIGLLTNWICKIIGSVIAFKIGRKFGPKIYPLFKKEKVEFFQHLMDNEKVVMVYFILSSIPFTPSDFFSYFLGCSDMKFKHFLPIATFGSFGTALGLAFLGTGQALDKPLFLVILGLAISGGTFWLHKSKEKFHLE